MRKITLTPKSLLEYLGLNEIEDLKGETVAQLIIEKAVIVSGSEAFIVKEIKVVLPICVSFIGATCHAAFFLEDTDRNDNMAICLKK